MKKNFFLTVLPSYGIKVKNLIIWNKEYQEKYKDCEYTVGLKPDQEFKILQYTNETVEYCEDIEFLVGDKENPILMRRKIGKGFVYSICTNTDDKDDTKFVCFIENLIK